MSVPVLSCKTNTRIASIWSVVTQGEIRTDVVVSFFSLLYLWLHILTTLQLCTYWASEYVKEVLMLK